jgi:hypothetical protein
LDKIFSFLTVVASFVAVFFAFKSWRTVRTELNEKIAPILIGELKMFDPTHSLHFLIKNYGQGVAFNIKTSIGTQNDTFLAPLRPNEEKDGPFYKDGIAAEMTIACTDSVGRKHSFIHKKDAQNEWHYSHRILSL